MDILKEIADGHAVSLVPVASEVTTQQAAELECLSPLRVGLSDKATPCARMVGNHCRLPLQDVVTYKAGPDAGELSAYDQELRLE